jgi:hypothetical protein
LLIILQRGFSTTGKEVGNELKKNLEENLSQRDLPFLLTKKTNTERLT